MFPQLYVHFERCQTRRAAVFNVACGAGTPGCAPGTFRNLAYVSPEARAQTDQRARAAMGADVRGRCFFIYLFFG